MTLTVNSFGNSISKSGNCIVVSGNDGKREIAADKITEVKIGTACSITSEFIKLCSTKGIDITFINNYGEPYADLESFASGCSPIIKRKQLLLADNDLGLNIVKKLQKEKINNRIRFLKELAKNRPSKKEYILNSCNSMSRSNEMLGKIVSVTVNESRERIQGIEGIAGRLYFSVLADLLPAEYKPLSRNIRPAKDIFNVLLNYGYGVLYGKIKNMCREAKMDPYIGIMHVDTYNKPTFVYDLIEPFRFYVERAAFNMCSRRQVHSLDLEKGDEALCLSAEIRQIFLSNLFKISEKSEICNGKKLTVCDAVSAEVNAVAKMIREDG